MLHYGPCSQGLPCMGKQSVSALVLSHPCCAGGQAFLCPFQDSYLIPLWEQAVRELGNQWHGGHYCKGTVLDWMFGANQSLCEFWHLNKRCIVKRIVRKVLLGSSPWSCDGSKEQSSPDWAAVHTVSEWVCIHSLYLPYRQYFENVPVAVAVESWVTVCKSQLWEGWEKFKCSRSE